MRSAIPFEILIPCRQMLYSPPWREESPIQNRKIGPWLVFAGALLWATDAIFRSTLTQSFPAFFIVTVTHLICLPVTLTLFLRQENPFQGITRAQWLALFTLSAGGSVLAMVSFTHAFATTSNYNVPILLQKLQPLVAIILARLFLKEKPSLTFYLLAALAIFGGYLISFGDLGALGSLREARWNTVFYALLAASIWGACTVAGRFLLQRYNQTELLSIRYLMATVFLLIGSALLGQWSFFGQIEVLQFKNFALMALIPGLLALFVYYSGLKDTPASLATIGELAFPLGAILVNWQLLNSPLNLTQIIGTVILLSSSTLIHWRKF